MARSRPRTVPAFVEAPAHNGREISCRTATECAIHTVGLTEGHFAAIVLSNPERDIGTIAFMDEAEVEAHIALLRNAIDDAKRLDRGEPARHATHSLRRS